MHPKIFAIWPFQSIELAGLTEGNWHSWVWGCMRKLDIIFQSQMLWIRVLPLPCGIRVLSFIQGVALRTQSVALRTQGVALRTQGVLPFEPRVLPFELRVLPRADISLALQAVGCKRPIPISG